MLRMKQKANRAKALYVSTLCTIPIPIRVHFLNGDFVFGADQRTIARMY